MHTDSNFRLLVVRLGAMGDILHALPAVTALREVQRHVCVLLDQQNRRALPVDGADNLENLGHHHRCETERWLIE